MIHIAMGLHNRQTSSISAMATLLPYNNATRRHMHKMSKVAVHTVMTRHNMCFNVIAILYVSVFSFEVFCRLTAKALQG